MYMLGEMGADDVMCCPGIYQYLCRLSIDDALHSQQVVLPYQLYVICLVRWVSDCCFFVFRIAGTFFCRCGLICCFVCIRHTY